jgi:hypothetical protein
MFVVLHNFASVLYHTFFLFVVVPLSLRTVVFTAFGRRGLVSSGSELGLVVGSCEHGNEPLGSIKVVNILLAEHTVSFSRRTLFHEGSGVGIYY